MEPKQGGVMEFVADYLRENQIANVITFICVMTFLCVTAWKLSEWEIEKQNARKNKKDFIE